jgi:oxalate decarboxylase/phosphoglucose isomerase-like protein (cupin superfamily)
VAEANEPFCSKSAGSLYVIAHKPGGATPEIQKNDLSLAAVPEIEGRANAGFSYGSVFEVQDRGVSIARGHFDANGLVTPHKTRNLYIVFVVRGSGKLVLFGEDQKTTEIDFKAGDVIALPPATLHQWRNGGEPFDFVGVESWVPNG